jgi:UDP-N-acetylglucosamine 4-epimerase
MVSNKRILVTGGAGFIGSNLCEKLLALDNTVVCLDNFSTGRLQNIQAFVKNSAFQLIKGDIRDFTTCQQAVKGVDYVLHHAALGSVPRSINNPIDTNAVNVTGFLNMLVAAKDATVRRFVYACSSSTYGDSTAMPKVEDIIGKPLSPYAVTKYLNELYGDVFYKVYGLESIGLRYFNVFGPKQDAAGAYAAVIPKFVSQLINHQSPVINGDGTTSRDFTFVANVVQANLLALSTENKTAINSIFNIAYGGRSTLNELVTFIKHELSDYDQSISQIETVYSEPRIGDIQHSFASIEKAKSLLGYQPQYSLSEGLKETVAWYLQNMEQ